MSQKVTCLPALSFNEGGADCPPKPVESSTSSMPQESFNEGGADCPPKRLRHAACHQP